MELRYQQSYLARGEAAAPSDLLDVSCCEALSAEDE